MTYRTTIAACFTLLVAVCLSVSCSGGPEIGLRSENIVLADDGQLDEAVKTLYSNPFDLQNSRAVWAYLTTEHRFRELVEIAEPYCRVFSGRDNSGGRESLACVYAYLAQAYLFLDDFRKTEECLSQVWRYDSSLDDARVATMVHNTEAILALKTKMDYSRAMHHLRIALDRARSLDDELSQCPILCNMGAIYYERSDTCGLKYARLACEIAERNNDHNMLLYSLMLMANMNVLAENYELASVYADKVRRELSPDSDSSYRLMLSLIYGDVFQRTERYREADSVYAGMLRLRRELDSGMLLELYCKYGSLLLRMKDYTGAKEFFEKGLELSLSCGNIEDRHHLLLGISDACYNMGDQSGALFYYKRYHDLLDSISLVRKERDFHQLLMSYDKLAYEKELHAREMGTQRIRYRNLVMLSILFVVFVVLAGVYVLYRRRMAMYRKLVEQHQLYVERVKYIEAEGVRSGGRMSLTEDKAQEYYGMIEQLMSERKIYRDSGISLEQLAKILGTNRSYVSEIINRYAGVSFPSYINMKRIEEATVRLSDLSDDTPLKTMCSELGFNSISVFYRAFQKETGCPPSRYREEVRAMKKRKVPVKG